MILPLYKNLILDLADGRPEGFMNIVSGNSQDFTCLTQFEYLGCNLYIDGLCGPQFTPPHGKIGPLAGLQLANSQFLKFPKIIWI